MFQLCLALLKYFPCIFSFNCNIRHQELFVVRLLVEPNLNYANRDKYIIDPRWIRLKLVHLVDIIIDVFCIWDYVCIYKKERNLYFFTEIFNTQSSCPL